MLVKFNATRVLGFKDRMIIPGINDLPEDLVADMMEDDIMADKFDREELEIIGKEDVGAKKVVSKKGSAPSGVDLLLAASDKNAKNLAGSTVDLTILETWLMREKRGPIKKAIKDQIAKIKNIKYREEKDKQKLEKSSEGDEE